MEPEDEFNIDDPALADQVSDDTADEQDYGPDTIATLDDTGSESTDDVISRSIFPDYIKTKFQAARNKRRYDENRWLMAYRNYRGIYGDDVKFSDHEKSRVFVKVTKTKVLAAYGQLVEVLFGAHKFPLSIEPTQLPDGVVESAHLMLKADVTPEMKSSLSKNTRSKSWRFKGTEEAVPEEIVDSLDGDYGYLKDFLEPVEDQLIEGEAPMGNEAVTFHPALVTAKKMEKKIHDQLGEAQADKYLRAVAFDAALFGTGVMKGPFATDKEYPRWIKDETTGQMVYDPLIKTVPDFAAVSVWNAYPDPEAYCQEDAEFFIERHKMSSKQLRDLKSRPFFRDNVIESLIDDGPNYSREWWETQIEDDVHTGDVENTRWEVLEFWGYVDMEVLKEVKGLKIPRKLRKEKQLQVNAWISDDKLLRVVLNPFKPSHIPYYSVPYELNPYSYFGVGVAENMADSQMLINGFMRMAVDNQALSGNLIFEVDASNLAPGQSLDVYPGKVFVRESGAPGQAIFGTEFPNVAQQNLQLFQQARQLADESTGLPSYMHGETNVQSTGRTASGISMLMGAATGSIKTVVKNMDDYLLRPLGKAIFAFNMQFDPDEDIKGDLEVHARATESLMANEVRSQRLMQFLQILSNPMTMPFGKIDYIVREIAKSLDLDPEKVTNNLADAAVMAKLLQKMQPQDAQGGPNAGGSPPAPPAGADAGDPTGRGGGTMAGFGAPEPGAPGFSANTGSGNGAGEP